MTKELKLFEGEMEKTSMRKLPEGPFLFPKQLIQKMKDTIDESIIRDKELGFTLCKKSENNELSNGHLCEGEQCQVLVLQLPKECKKGEIPVGTFHTHGCGRASPSVHDLWTAYQSNANCIGGLYHGKKEIKCYDRKKEFDPDIYKRITDDVIIENDFIQKIKDWQNKNKKVTEQLFNATILKQIS